MKVRLTKRTVEAAQPPARGSLWLRDTDVRGLSLRVWRAGGQVRRAYVVSWPDGHGGKPQAVLGHHGAPWRPDPETGVARTLTLDAARQEAIRVLGARLEGRDPRATRAAALRIPTLFQFTNPREPHGPGDPPLGQWFKDWALTHKARRSAAEDRGNLERHVLPALGHLRLDQIGPEHVARLQADLRTHPTTANRCWSLLSKIVNDAILWRVLPRGHVNPCRGVPKFREEGRERILSTDELAAVGPALEAEEKGAPVAVAAIRVLAFTAARPIEVLSLRRAQLAAIVERGIIVQTSRKTRKGTRPIAFYPPAQLAAAEAPTVEGNEFLFPGQVEGRPLTIWGLEAAWERVRLRASGFTRRDGKWIPPEVPGVDVRDVRLYDLRHTMLTVLAEDGASGPLIQWIAGHSDPRTTQKYIHLAAGAGAKAGAAAADKIDEALGRRRPKEN